MKFYEIFTVPDSGNSLINDDIWVVYNIISVIAMTATFIIGIINFPMFVVIYFTISTILSLMMGVYWFHALRKNEEFLHDLAKTDSYEDIFDYIKVALFTIGLVFVNWLPYLPVFIFRYFRYRYETKRKVPFWVTILRKAYKEDIVEGKLGNK